MVDGDPIDNPVDDEGSTRRTVLKGAFVAGAVLPILAACDSDSDDGGPDTGTDGDGDAASQLPLPTSDVPEGGGVILVNDGLVVTQPTAGEFKAFSAVCTHQFCIVGEVSDGMIICPCHASMYSISTGQVVGGPAPQPLAETQVTVENGQITVS
jgi:Rieske Fe-S protein